MLIKIQILINKTRNIDKKTKMNNKVKIHTFQYLKKKQQPLFTCAKRSKKPKLILLFLRNNILTNLLHCLIHVV